MKAIKIAVAIAVGSLSLTAYAKDAKDVSADVQQTVIGQSIEGSFSSQIPVGVAAGRADAITGTVGRAITGTVGRDQAITGTVGRAITGTVGRAITGTVGR